MNKKMLLSVAAAGALALALTGCGAPASTEATSSAAGASSAAAASSAANEIISSTASEAESQQVGMPNPWQDVATADEAAQVAGLSGFSVPEGVELSLGTVGPWTFRSMDGIAEANSYVAAATLTVRKGLDPAGGEVAGDYNEYPLQWTQNIKGLEVTCFGHEENMAHKVLWSVDGTDYSIMAFGQGAVYDTFGLGAEDISSLVNGIQ